MNAISKKLLSMLVVMAMVLSMVPFGGLSVFAAETDETQVASSDVTPGQASLTEDIQAIIDKGNAIQTAAETALANNYCPVCETTVEWTALVSNKIPNSEATDAAGTHLHYVISGAVSYSGYNFNALTGSNITLCVLLDNAELTTTGRFRIAGTNNTLNVMGTGSITSDGSACEDLGLFTMDGTNPTLNLYGGNFTYTGTSLGGGTTPDRALINAVGTTANPTANPTVNIYGSATIGKAVVDTSVANYNVYVVGGTINMYGGMIRNGISGLKGISGNVTLASGSTFNMYGGEITGGNRLDSVTDNFGGNVLVGGYTKASATFGAGTFNMYGGSITAGNAKYGGAVYSPTSSAKVNISGGTIGGANAEDINNAVEGGAIYADGASNIVNISGSALLKGNCATSYGGNIHLNGATLTMEGGTVSGGYAATQGGNISGGSSSQINISGGSVYGGSFNPDGSGWGGNIRAYNATVNISGGYIYDGCTKNSTTNREAGNIGALGTSTLNISGGHIGGDIKYANGNLVLSGAPEIKYSPISLPDGTQSNQAHYNGILVDNNSNIDISELTTGAQIQVTGSVGAVFTAAHENAANVVDCFSCSNSAYAVDVNADNALYIVEAPEEEPTEDKFEPEKFNGEAYCPVCKDFVIWTAYNGENVTTALSGSHHHKYLDKDQTYSTACFALIYSNVCLNLNGYDITAVITEEATPGQVFSMGSSGTLNLMDTKTGEADGSVVTGYTNSTTYGAVIRMNGLKDGKTNTVNFYGGTYTKLASDTVAPLVYVGGNGGTVNIYEGTVIDGTGLTGNHTIYLLGNTTTKAVCNMYGGEIKGLTTSGNGAAVRLGNGTAGKTAEFYLVDGTVTAGTTSGDGGAIYGSMCAVNISGGTVQNSTNGSAKNGGLIGMAGSGAVLTISGGNITGGHSTSHGATILLATNSVLNMSGGTVTGGLADGQGGTIRAYRATLNLSGSAKIYAGATSNADTLSKCIWLVRSTLTMTDDSAVYGVGTNFGNAICCAVDDEGYGSTVTLSGNATVKHATGSSQRDLYVPYTADNRHKLQITQDWDGVAYFATFKDANRTPYGRGEAVSTTLAEVGTITDGDFTAGGSFSGDLYYSPQSNRPMMGKAGVVYVALAPITNSEGTTTYYIDYADALDAYYENKGFENGDYLTLASDNAELVLDGNIYVDSVGWAANVSGTGTLYAMDSSSDNYDDKYSIWTVSGGVVVAEDVTNPVNGNRYIVIKNKAGENKYSAHRIEVKLTDVTLRASEAGLYYKASYKCDATLADRVIAYGVAVSTNVTPGADFLEDYTNKIGFTCLENFADVYETTGKNPYTVNTTSGAVFGIFKTAAERPDTVDSNSNTVTTAQLNAEYGKMKIYANTYFLVDTLADEDADTNYVVVSDTENGGKQCHDATAENYVEKINSAYSLWDALKAINDKWDTLIGDDVDKQKLIADFYGAWKDAEVVGSDFWTGLDKITALSA